MDNPRNNTQGKTTDIPAIAGCQGEEQTLTTRPNSVNVVAVILFILV